MTSKEAIKLIQGIEEDGWNVTSDHVKALDLAIKALEIVDDVNHKIYRNENCPQKDKCYDYQGYHCAGCSWEAKKNEID